MWGKSAKRCKTRPGKVEPLITDTAGEFQFCPLQGAFVSWTSSNYPVRLKGHPWLTSTSLACRAATVSGPLYSSLSLSQITLDNWSAPATSVSLAEPVCYYEGELLTGHENSVCRTVHIHVFEKWNVIVSWAVLCRSLFRNARCCVYIAAYHCLFFNRRPTVWTFQLSLYHIVSHKPARDTEQSNRNRASLPDFHTSSGDNTTCIFPGAKRPESRVDHKLDTQLS
jgi:hypothetical protein